MRSSKRKSPVASSITAQFESLVDPRVVGRVSHPLITVIVMAVAAVVGGANGWEAIEDFVEDRKAWFETFLEMPHGVPDATTFYRVFKAVRPDAFERCARSWAQGLAEPLDGQVVAFDGKALRGALKRSRMGASLTMLHVWACEQRLMLAQRAVHGAAGEVEGIRDLLTMLDLRGAIVTGDAAHCNRETAQAIVDAEADYALQLKANRAGAHAVVQGFFEAAQADNFAGVKVYHQREINEGHGRTEIREAWSIAAETLDLPGEDWANLGSVTMLRKSRLVGFKMSTETHYLLSSLLPSCMRLAETSRAHWGVENGPHWSLDVQMDEDRCTIHEENAATNFHVLRTIALTLAKRDHSFKRGLRAKLAKAGRNIAYLEHLMSLGI